jgi:hypothetical protein
MSVIEECTTKLEETRTVVIPKDDIRRIMIYDEIMEGGWAINSASGGVYVISRTVTEG